MDEEKFKKQLRQNIRSDKVMSEAYRAYLVGKLNKQNTKCKLEEDYLMEGKVPYDDPVELAMFKKYRETTPEHHERQQIKAPATKA